MPTRRPVPESLANLERLPALANFGKKKIIYLDEEGKILTPVEALDRLQDALPVFYEVHTL